jgi:signal transduction histidine kinase
VAAVCLVDAHNQPSGMIVVSDRLPLARREMLDSLLRVFAVRVSNELERIKVDHALRELNMDLEQRVTQRTQQLQAANEELRELLDRLKQAQNELIRSEKLAALGSLVAGVAHEMSTPIGNGLMVSSTLKEHATEFAESLNQGIRRSQLDRFIDETRTSSDIILRNLERAGTLLSSFKQVAVDQTSSQRRRFDLAQVLGEVFLTLRPTLKQWPGQLENRVPQGLLMDSYPGPLGQVVSNFVNNALLHAYDMGQGGIMTVSAKVDGDWVRLDFQDDGKGIAPEHLSRVFDPFFTTRLGQGGSGLGLHICHNIVTQLLGGSLDVSSESGQGTCFHLTLPLRAPQTGARELPP